MDETALTNLIENNAKVLNASIALTARNIRNSFYGKKVFLRGLVEFTNYCKNGCFYCGINRENQNIHRYRLNDNQIINCIQNGYNLGLRSFVLQGGEDPYFTDDRMVRIVERIRLKFRDCSLTLSLGLCVK